jgi:hypothetical protein
VLQKMEISEKMLNYLVFGTLVTIMVLAILFHSISVKIQDVINRNNMPALEFILRFSLYQ